MTGEVPMKPQTQAGRALLDWLYSSRNTNADPESLVAAIEREAAAAGAGADTDDD